MESSAHSSTARPDIGLLARLFARDQLRMPGSTASIARGRFGDNDRHTDRRRRERQSMGFRTVWISDIHLGTRACKAEYLLEFLNHVECDRLFLVGDIIDFWAMKSSWYWPQSHNRVLQKFMELAARGVDVIYVPGNHDEMFREYAGALFAGVRVESRFLHRTADGRKLLVIHGDEFDSIVKYSKWLAMLGSQIYDFLLYANRWVNFFRRQLGFPYWSLASCLKQMTKGAVNFISHFEHALAHEARRHKVDGVVCGHIHKAAIETVNGVRYCNDGDWVESCTALIERQDGSLAVLQWTDKVEWLIDERGAVEQEVQEAA